MTCLETRVQQSGSIGCAAIVTLANVPGGTSAREDVVLPGRAGCAPSVLKWRGLLGWSSQNVKWL